MELKILLWCAAGRSCPRAFTMAASELSGLLAARLGALGHCISFGPHQSNPPRLHVVSHIALRDLEVPPKY